MLAIRLVSVLSLAALVNGYASAQLDSTADSSTTSAYSLTEAEIVNATTPQSRGDRKPLSRDVIKLLESDDVAGLVELIRKGGRFSVYEYWRSNSRYQALEFAISERAEDVALFLIDLGAKPSLAGPSVALEECVAKDLARVCEALVQNGFDPTLPATFSRNGETVLDFASEQSSPEIYAALGGNVEKQVEIAEAREEERAVQSRLADPSQPLTCPETQYSNLTREQGAAVQYLLERKLSQTRDGSEICIESIVASEKIPLRGNTVVKYRAVFHYPRGYKVQCLRDSGSNDYWRNFERDLDCSPFFGEAKEPGARRYYDGSEEI